jgi:glycosyltransferase involved in cell wall biosynthesis
MGSSSEASAAPSLKTHSRLRNIFMENTNESRTVVKLSVIIPCLNAARTLSIQLEALAQQRWDQPWEIILADNGSTDQSLQIAERYRARLPQLRVVDASARRGQPYALNAGAAAAYGEALAFCDADDEVGDGWVRAMGQALSQHDFVACRMDFQKLNPPWLNEVVGGHEQQRGGFLKAWFPPYLPHAGGGSLGVKKFLHETVGGFDESLPYQHDTDYCFKIQLRGTELHFVRDAVMHIRCRSTLSGLFQQSRHWAEYTILLYKYYRTYETTRGRPWWYFLQQCKRLALSAPQVHYKAGRAMWVWNLGWQLGRLIGSLKHHVPPV